MTVERRAWSSWRRRARLAAALATAAALAVLLVDNRRDLAGALDRLSRVRWGWLAVAGALEALSMGPFARLQRWLLRAGGARLGFWRMVGISLAGNAIGTSLPGGAAWSVVWVFRQLRRRGADSALTVWALVMAGVLSGVTLFVLLVTGLWLAGARGPLEVLRWPTLGVVGLGVVALCAALAVRGRAPTARVAALAGRLATALRRWPAGVSALDAARDLPVRLSAVFVHPGSWVKVVAFAAANWLLDLASLVTCILAVRGAVPWRGILVVYAMAEIAASLPVTPGGIGVVDGSMVLLLDAYGSHTAVALAAVALYRVLSFWGLAVLGWIAWLVIAVGERRASRRLCDQSDP